LLLNLGCGGGKNVFSLKRDFQVTGLDLSPAMLDLARRLNPECKFVRGDMRSFSLEERFDAILIDDAISYMVTEAELRQVFDMTYAHLNPGGVMVVEPDDLKENFENYTRVTRAAPDYKPANVDVVFVEDGYDPDPQDDVYEGTMVYLIRENGKLRIEHDFHLLGLFSIDVWRRELRGAGFEVHESKDGDCITFACVKPT
jgi:SAM-dependent methyltransferase